ncbi:hypothetical protein AAVH_39693, partial [Aphelenchoides avenae]
MHFAVSAVLFIGFVAPVAEAVGASCSSGEDSLIPCAFGKCFGDRVCEGKFCCRTDHSYDSHYADHTYHPNDPDDSYDANNADYSDHSHYAYDANEGIYSL